MAEAVNGFVGPHDVGHVLGQLAHHIGVLGHDVAPHGQPNCVGSLGLHHLVATVDEIHIDLVGAFLVHQFLGASGAELLGLVAVDDEEGRVGDAVVGSLDALAQEIVDLGVAGVEVGAAVHQVLVEGYAQRLLGVGEELEVDDLVAVRLAVGQISRCQVGELFLVEGVLGVVVAEVVLQGVQRLPLLLTVGGVRHGAAALVVHPAAVPICRPVEDGAAGQCVVQLTQLGEGQTGILQSLGSFVIDGNLARFNGQAVSLAIVAVEMRRLRSASPFKAPFLHLGLGQHTRLALRREGHLLRRGYQAEVDLFFLCRRRQPDGQQHDYHYPFHRFRISLTIIMVHHDAHLHVGHQGLDFAS